MTHHFPSSVDVNHLTNFSTRLYYQLQHKTHRETLAEVEEAFSKAMGFENKRAIIHNCATQLFVNNTDPSLLNVLYQDRIETVRL